ncbi:hypothetical protein GN316_13925 [Xylophilus sp. Kf1]|nr:hypothetical protein [Xylophilus sp. Kf1]
MPPTSGYYRDTDGMLASDHFIHSGKRREYECRLNVARIAHALKAFPGFFR